MSAIVFPPTTTSQPKLHLQRALTVTFSPVTAFSGETKSNLLSRGSPEPPPPPPATPPPEPPLPPEPPESPLPPESPPVGGTTGGAGTSTVIARFTVLIPPLIKGIAPTAT